MVTTKWAREHQSNVDKYKERIKDEPVAISKESLKEEEDLSITYYCNRCRRNLIRLGYNDYHCMFCGTSSSPLTDDKKPQRSQSYEPNPEYEDNETLIAYTPDDDNDKQKIPTLKSGLDTFNRGTIRITEDIIKDGSGRIIKSESRSSGYSNSHRGHAKGPYPSSTKKSETDIEDIELEEVNE
jgi:hypothetical protein